jgi:hypothetical protein
LQVYRQASRGAKNPIGVTFRRVPSRFYRVSLEEIAYVRAVVEGYDGVAVVRGRDPRRGEIEWIIGEGLEDEALAIAGRLQREAGLIEIPRPTDWDSSL